MITIYKSEIFHHRNHRRRSITFAFLHFWYRRTTDRKAGSINSTLYMVKTNAHSLIYGCMWVCAKDHHNNTHPNNCCNIVVVWRINVKVMRINRNIDVMTWVCFCFFYGFGKFEYWNNRICIKVPSPVIRLQKIVNDFCIKCDHHFSFIDT